MEDDLPSQTFEMSTIIKVSVLKGIATSNSQSRPNVMEVIEVKSNSDSNKCLTFGKI